MGSSGLIYRFNGTSWSEQPSGGSGTLRSVWGSSSSSVFAVGESGTILRYNGTSWSTQTAGTAQHLFGVWGSSASNVFAVGDNGTILSSPDGITWTARAVGYGYLNRKYDLGFKERV